MRFPWQKKEDAEQDDRASASAEGKASLASSAFLRAIKPKSGYIYHSDYFDVDGGVACVLMYLHNSAASDKFPPFWGINRFPINMTPDVTTVNFEQISRVSDGWIQAHQSRAEGVVATNDVEQQKHGTNTTRGTSGKARYDMQVIAEELNNGAAYLHVHDRLLVRAATLESLDAAIDKIERYYTDKFGTLSAAPYIGDQRRELATLFASNEAKRGRGEYFTSTEYAGAYHLVTHGLEDARGEYVGFMIGDVNNAAMLFDVDAYRHHIVVATEQYNRERGRAHVADMWGAKIGQACLARGGRVVHLLLDKCDMSRLGPTFDSFTSVIDMNHGDVNLFEVFGKREDTLSLFPAQMQKLVLMAEQAYDATDSDRTMMRTSFEEVATKFYVEQGMWRENAEANFDKLRLVGIPHTQVPLLQVFVSYLDMEYKAMAAQAIRDDTKLRALSTLSATFTNLLHNNGDIFNTHTTPTIDAADGGRRIIFDFSKLLDRGGGVAMAQLINVCDFAFGQVGEGDTIIVHSAERIVDDDDVRDYISTRFDRVFSRGGRVAMLYNSIEKMIEDKPFNNFNKADYTILGNMSETTLTEYQTALGQKIPPDLADRITDRATSCSYIRRGYDNVVFQLDLKLDPEQIQTRQQMR